MNEFPLDVNERRTERKWPCSTLVSSKAWILPGLGVEFPLGLPTLQMQAFTPIVWRQRFGQHRPSNAIYKVYLMMKERNKDRMMWWRRWWWFLKALVGEAEGNSLLGLNGGDEECRSITLNRGAWREDYDGFSPSAGANHATSATVMSLRWSPGWKVEAEYREERLQDK